MRSSQAARAASSLISAANSACAIGWMSSHQAARTRVTAASSSTGSGSSSAAASCSPRGFVASRSRTEPVWQDGQFVPRLMLPLSLSYDHRIVDGADGIRFLRYIVDRLEHPFLLSLQ